MKRKRNVEDHKSHVQFVTVSEYGGLVARVRVCYSRMECCLGWMLCYVRKTCCPGRVLLGKGVVLRSRGLLGKLPYSPSSLIPFASFWSSVVAGEILVYWVTIHMILSSILHFRIITKNIFM